jgi:hypothetical protein
MRATDHPEPIFHSGAEVLFQGTDDYSIKKDKARRKALSKGRMKKEHCNLANYFN